MCICGTSHSLAIRIVYLRQQHLPCNVAWTAEIHGSCYPADLLFCMVLWARQCLSSESFVKCPVFPFWAVPWMCNKQSSRCCMSTRLRVLNFWRENAIESHCTIGHFVYISASPVCVPLVVSCSRSCFCQSVHLLRLQIFASWQRMQRS